MAERKQRRAPSKVTGTGKVDAEGAKRAAADLVQGLRGRGIDRAKIGGFDLDGVLRGKYVSLDKLESALGKGFGFCDVIFGWDVADALYDNAKVTGWHSGYPDANAQLDPLTLRNIPWEPGAIAMLADFRTEDGSAHPACPRSLLKKVIARAQKLGYQPMVGAEYEFYLFKETRDSLQEKGFRHLTPLDPGMFGYSWVRSGQDSELMRDIMQGMREFDIELEGLHTETGPGVYEAAIRFDEALKTADRAALFKVALKQIAHRHGVSVTFMAKWNASLPGSSGHLHRACGKTAQTLSPTPSPATCRS
jgi:glutamine synthetase